MSLSKLPSGRWRAQVHDPSVGHNVSVSKVLGPAYASFATRREAKAAREQARKRLGTTRDNPMTVMEWWTIWTTDRLWERPKASTNLNRAAQAKAFATAHANVPICSVDDGMIAAWLRGGKRNGQVPVLRAMFNDAARPMAGRLVARNPFAGLGISQGVGNRGKQPPTEEMAISFAREAYELKHPGFAAWLQVACFTGMRPGELDALTWNKVDFDNGLIRVDRQFSGRSRTFTTPKNGLARWAILTPLAREALEDERTQGSKEFCFAPSVAKHFSEATRRPYWNSVRKAAGWSGTLYLGTRHFAGWYMVNVLRLPYEDVAVALGHTDGGDLVRTLYGHLDEEQALDRVARAFTQVGRVVDLDSRRRGVS